MNYSVALDGPSGSGKSTVASFLAKKLNIVHIDTGAMYRAVTLYCLFKGIDPKDEKAVVALLPECHIVLTVDNKVLLNDIDVSAKIRSNEVSDAVSYVSVYKAVRSFLVQQQRKMADNISVIMDGRDIGTVVLPKANVKIYLVASVEKRAARRAKEHAEKGIIGTYDDALENLKKRDYIDSHREISPLKPAPDSIILDTSDLDIQQSVEKCYAIVLARLAELGIQA